MPGNPKRNIVFFGEIGMGKSSAINLLLGATSARVSNDSQPCTQVSASYDTTLNGTRCTLWDTRGLGEGYSFLRNIFGFGAEKELKRFLKERHQRREIDLLVYCVRGSRATDASVKYYSNFCAITRQLAAPVVIMVTHLERGVAMEDWWQKNSPAFEKVKMEFDDHVCVTTLPKHARSAESRQRLVDLITKKHRWEPKRSGSFFGSPVQISSPPVPQRKGVVSSLFKSRYKGDSNEGHLSRRPSDLLERGAPSVTDSSRHSSYHTAPSGNSVPPSPVVEPPTPCSATGSVRPHIDTSLLGADGPPQPPSEETPSAGPSPYSMCMGSHSSNTSHSEVYLQSCTDENEDSLLSELPFKHSTDIILRRKGYASRQGSFGDIWECNLISGESSRLVAVKAVRICTNGDKDLKSHEKKLRRELKVWGSLRHKNIVPLLGVVSGFGHLPSMVSPWFHNGSLSSYLVQHEMSKLQEHGLLEDIAAGLCYLHSHDVIHGDLHSDNVLIDDCGRACLTDFGLSFVGEFVGTSYLNSSICGGVQFADPALVQRVNNSENHVFYPTKPCDVYSFGGLMLHVLFGMKPYDGLPPATIFLNVLEGKRPKIPTQDRLITPWHKSLIRKCWDPEERKRPSADSLVKMFARQ